MAKVSKQFQTSKQRDDFLNYYASLLTKNSKNASLAGFFFSFSIKGSIPLLGSSPLGKFIVLIFSKRSD